jgi:CBS domain containing-hemolysin-like protein
MFFTVVQIGLNAVAILGGIVGDAAFSRRFIASLFSTCPQNWQNS